MIPGSFSIDIIAHLLPGTLRPQVNAHVPGIIAAVIIESRANGQTGTLSGQLHYTGMIVGPFPVNVIADLYLGQRVIEYHRAENEEHRSKELTLTGNHWIRSSQFFHSLPECVLTLSLLPLTCFG
jgi:hypothetical protein